MAGNITDGLRRHWERHFKSLDKDGSDMLTVEELSRGLADRGVTISSNSLKSALNVLDPNNDGRVTKDEFVNIMSKPSRQNRMDLRNAFQKMDSNNDGFVTKQELIEAMRNAGMDVDSMNFQSAITEVDKDRDGRISYDEFMMYM